MIAVGDRVVGTSRLSVTTRIHSGLLPGGQHEGLSWQRYQRRSLDPVEDDEGALMSGIMKALSSYLATPDPGDRVDLFEAEEGVPRPEGIVHVINRSLDRGLVFGKASTAGVDEDATVVGEPLVATVESAVVEVSLEHT